RFDCDWSSDVCSSDLDGNGHFTQTGNSHGSVSGDYSGDGSGTYTVNANCSGTATLTLSGVGVTLNLWIVVVDQGREVRLVVRTRSEERRVGKECRSGW